MFARNWIGLAGCIVVFAACASARAGTMPFSDDFNGSTLNAGWTVVSPNPDSSIGLTGSGGLQMVASYQNGGSDLYSGTNFNGDRILQPVDPSANWIIETELDFSPGDNYEGAGILLSTTDGPYTAEDQYSRVAERFFGADGSEITGNTNGTEDLVPVGAVPYTDSTSYFRLEKVGTMYTGWWSSDGVTWNSSGSSVDATQYPYVGLFTIRYPWDDAPVNSVATFDYFDVTAVPVPEPSTLVLAALPIGLGLLWTAKRRSQRGPENPRSPPSSALKGTK
jgi:cytochrome c